MLLGKDESDGVYFNENLDPSTTNLIDDFFGGICKMDIGMFVIVQLFCLNLFDTRKMLAVFSSICFYI